MKKLLLITVFACLGTVARAQLYKDSLYNVFSGEVKKMRFDEIDYNKVLFRTCEQLFSIKHPAMQYAIKQSGMEDSAAIAVLGREVMDKFLNDEFIAMVCDHYETKNAPINKFYTEELCIRVEGKMRTAGKLPPDEMARLLETTLMESSAAMAKNKDFAAKAVKVREEYGIDRILHAVECNTPYMYVYCPYMHQYMVNATVGNAVDNFVKWKKEEQMRMYASIKEYILSGEDAALKDFATAKPVLNEMYKSLGAMRKRAKELKPGRNDVLYRPVVNGNKTVLSYVYVSPKPEILGGVDLNVQWKDHKWHISQSRAVAQEDVKDKQTLLNIAAMQKMPVNKKVEEE